MTQQGGNHKRHGSVIGAVWLIVIIVGTLIIVGAAYRWDHSHNSVTAGTVALFVAMLGVFFGASGVAFWLVSRKLSKIT
jgi:hypothetical protein